METLNITPYIPEKVWYCDENTNEDMLQYGDPPEGSHLFKDMFLQISFELCQKKCKYPSCDKVYECFKEMLRTSSIDTQIPMDGFLMSVPGPDFEHIAMIDLNTK